MRVQSYSSALRSDFGLTHTRSLVHPAMMDAPSLFSRANSTAPHTATWRSGPTVDTRGTWDIISICLSTLLICVWKAVHIDIPLHQGQSNFVNKLGWLVAGILAPDMLLYIACCQAYGAYIVHVSAKEYLDCPPEPPGWSSYPSRFLNYVRSRLKVQSSCRCACLQVLTANSNTPHSRRKSSVYSRRKNGDTGTLETKRL